MIGVLPAAAAVSAVQLWACQRILRREFGDSAVGVVDSVKADLRAVRQGTRLRLRR
jgi:hypothetical protein